MGYLGVRLIEISKMFAFIENIWLGACLVRASALWLMFVATWAQVWLQMA